MMLPATLVTSFTLVWIKMPAFFTEITRNGSRASRSCGLKCAWSQKAVKKTLVTSFTLVWIKIRLYLLPDGWT